MEREFIYFKETSYVRKGASAPWIEGVGVWNVVIGLRGFGM